MVMISQLKNTHNKQGFDGFYYSAWPPGAVVLTNATGGDSRGKLVKYLYHISIYIIINYDIFNIIFDFYPVFFRHFLDSVI